MKRMSLRVVGLMMIAMAAFCSVLLETASAADFGLAEVGTSLQINGDLSRQAGAHADFTTSLKVNTEPSLMEDLRPTGDLRTVKVALPPGLLGSPASIPTCTGSQLVAGPNGNSSRCPIASQVGVAIVYQSNFGLHDALKFALYNMQPPVNLPGAFAFNYAGVIVYIEPNVRPTDHGITATAPRISQAQPLIGTDVTLWGVPADPSHDADRFDPDKFGLNFGGYGVSSKTPSVAFLTNPTSCGSTPSQFQIDADSWQNPGAFLTNSLSSDLEGTPYLFNGCGRLSFSPTTSVTTSSQLTASPTGLVVDIDVPQSQDAYGLASSQVKDVKMTLPQGVTVSPSSASGLGACSLEQIGLGSNEAPTCPESSKIGTVSVVTPLLKDPLEGDVILAKQNENPFNSLLALYLSIKGPGFYVKLPGKVETDSRTGQLTVTFDNNPQVPFEELRLELNNGPRAPLSTPSQCGTYSVQTEITPWSGTAPLNLSSPITINQNCNTGGFSPKLNAGTVDPTGGSYSPFTLQVTRADGETNLSKIQATLPPGLLAKLAGVPLCGDAEASTGNCPATSQIGTVTAGVGTGSNPLYIPQPGKAPTATYLAGPYQGAPYSLVAKIPAQAGPFDLGTVLQRERLFVDPKTTQVTAESEPLPQILEGIPVTYRDVRVEITRPQFIVNPTNCSQFAVTSLLTSSSGQTASPNAPFTAANCERLDFKPTLALQMKGSIKRTGNPALTATLKAPAGQANIASTTVILPKTVFIDQRHVSNPCTRVQFAANACPAKSVLGTAVAYSPLLDKPLEGPVYFRSNGGERQLPDLVADLNGQIHVELVGFIDSKKVGKETSLVRTRFASIPDAPVSKFVLGLKGGKRSLIQNSANLCKVQPKAEVEMTGQNGKTNDFKQKIAVKCGGGKKSKKAKGGH